MVIGSVEMPYIMLRLPKLKEENPYFGVTCINNWAYTSIVLCVSFKIVTAVKEGGCYGSSG